MFQLLFCLHQGSFVEHMSACFLWQVLGACFWKQIIWNKILYSLGLFCGFFVHSKFVFLVLLKILFFRSFGRPKIKCFSSFDGGKSTTDLMPSRHEQFDGLWTTLQTLSDAKHADVVEPEQWRCWAFADVTLKKTFMTHVWWQLPKLVKLCKYHFKTWGPRGFFVELPQPDW